MKQMLVNGWNSFLSLFRLLAWYGTGIAVLFYLLPIAGLIVENHYETLISVVRFSSVLGIFLVIGAWHAISTRDRWREQA